MADKLITFENETELRTTTELPFLKNLRKTSAGKLKELSELCPFKTYRAIAFDWLLIASAIAFSEAWFNPFSYFLAIGLIAGRQHAFLSITHEGVHYRISHHHGWNDFVSDWFAAYPFFFDTEMYRRSHIKHHRHLNTMQDPDWARKVDQPQWKFPIKMSYILKWTPRFVLWKGLRDWLSFSLPMTGLYPFNMRLLAKRMPFYVMVYGAIAYFNVWTEFFLYWLVPFTFVFPSFQRIRSVAEHFGMKYNHELSSSRNVFAPWYECLLFGPHQMNYHLVHHMFPSVPFYNLKAFNDILEKDAEYREHAVQNKTYIFPSEHSMLMDILGVEAKTPKPDRGTEPGSESDTSRRSAA